MDKVKARQSRKGEGDLLRTGTALAVKGPGVRPSPWPPPSPLPSSCHPDFPSARCSARPTPGTFLPVDDAQRAGVADEQLPVVQDAKCARVHVGEVEEVVEVVGPQGLQDPEQLVGQVGRLVRAGAVEVPQRAGAGADSEAAAGAQVLGQRPALGAREDLRAGRRRRPSASGSRPP